MGLILLLLSLAAAEARPFTRPKPPEPEYGFGLSAADADAGWLSVFDGSTPFGWAGADVREGRLEGGTTTTEFQDFDLRISTISGGELIVGSPANVVHVPAGTSTRRVEHAGRGPIRLGKGLVARSVLVRPVGLKPMGLGEGGAAGWKVIPHASLPANRQTTWTVEGGTIHAVGGPGCAELPGDYADFILQARVRTLRPLTNSGVFFRCRRGDFLNGYEAQVFNGCYDEDPARPARYATGAIDDRQNARRLVSRDSEPFTMTVIAAGPHVATWVNGAQVTDWADPRPKDDNARVGLRLAAGPIQLQAHEKTTDVVFERLQIVPLD